MKRISKKILITILMAVSSLILIFAVSCNDDKTGGGVSPTSPEADIGSITETGGGSGTGTESGTGSGGGTGTERNLSYYAGTWTSSSPIITVIIQSNALTISNYSTTNITIAASNITRVSDTNYVYSNNNNSIVNTRFSFTSILVENFILILLRTLALLINHFLKIE